MGNVQRMLLLPGGANGGWSQEAEERLEKLLAKPLVSKVSKPLPIEDAAPLAIEDGQQDADDSSSESSSDSDSSSDQCMTTEEVEKAMKYKGDQSAKAKVEFESISLLSTIAKKNWQTPKARSKNRMLRLPCSKACWKSPVQ